jgi:Domain of unknown function (DUF4132)
MDVTVLEEEPAAEYRERLARLRQSLDRREHPAAALQLERIAGLCEEDWSGSGAGAIDVVQALTPAERALMVEQLMDRLDNLSWHAPQLRRSMTQLLTLVSHGLPIDLLRRSREGYLRQVERNHTVSDAHRLAKFAGAEIASGRPLSPGVVATIRRTGLESWQRSELADLLATLREPAVNPGEPWADRALEWLATAGPQWTALCVHAATAGTAKPSVAWQRTARSLLEGLEPDAVRAEVVSWLALSGRPRPQPLTFSHGGDVDVNHWDPYNAEALRGLAWLLCLLPAGANEADAARALAGLAETALRKVPGVGPRSLKVANAAVYALSRLPGPDALAQLARLAARVTAKGTLKQITTALDARARALGLSREQVEELAVPGYGLTAVGHRTERFGDDAEAELTVEGRSVRLTWRTDTGRVVTSPPRAVRRDHAEQLKALKEAAKDIEKMLTAQSDRLDRQFLGRRRWTAADWRAQFLDHPLVGTLARRLLWRVDGTVCGWADGALRNLADDDLGAGPTVDPGAAVELWHPVGESPERIVAWRDWLERHAIVQPFKQAHREVYLLTAAEEDTGSYSNRFAAHLLKQHQFHALAALRGWRNQLRLAVDDSCPPATRELPAWGLRAEYWIEGLTDGGDHDDLAPSGSYLYLRTDQVRFYPIDAPGNYAHVSGGGGYTPWIRPGTVRRDPLPLTAVPPLVLSEVLRDVDLFVGVASLGNDPTWSDGGPDGRFRDYWTSYGFGELSETAKGRGETLSRLLPRLALGERCQVAGRFLQVRGDLRTYRIHLGSGNILMTPDDSYLCIVPGQGEGTAGSVALPFEGDRTLAVILSKALMLAKDTEITDPTITSQLRR